MLHVNAGNIRLTDPTEFGFSTMGSGKPAVFGLREINLPTADQVRNRVDLGEVNQLLVQKIEELTLYLIEVNKQNDILKKRVDTLELQK